jgi:hypothetical protein
MSYDADLMLFDLDKCFELVDTDIDIYERILKSIDKHNFELFNRKKIEVNNIKEWKMNLKIPPNVNEGNLYKLFTGIKFYPTMIPWRFKILKFHFVSRQSEEVIEQRVPEFLNEYSSMASDLWRKMIGDGSTCIVIINDNEYIIKRGNGVGFIYKDELYELANELEPILPYTKKFYDQLNIDLNREQYFVGIEKLQIIDFIYIICRYAEYYSINNPILTYLNDQKGG